MPKRCVIANIAKPDANKKRRAVEVDPLASHKSIVVDSLMESNLPESTKDMLKVVLPFAYEQPRHDYQNKVLDMLLDTFTNAEADLQSTVDEEQNQLNSAEEQRSNLEAAITAADAVVQEAVSKVSTSAELKAQAEESLAQASSALSAKETEHNAILAQAGKAEESKLLLEIAMTSKLELMEMIPKNPSKVASLKVQLDVLIQDRNLVNAVQLSLNKEPAERGSFDCLVLVQLDKEFIRLEQKNEAEIGEAEPSTRACQEALAALASAQEKSAQHAQEMRESHKQCVAERKSADLDLGMTKSSLKCFEKESKLWVASLETAKTAVADFQHGPMESLRVLTTGVILEPQDLAVDAQDELLEEATATATHEVQEPREVQEVGASNDVDMAQLPVEQPIPEAAEPIEAVTELPIQVDVNDEVPTAQMKLDDCPSTAPPPPELVGCAGA